MNNEEILRKFFGNQLNNVHLGTQADYVLAGDKDAPEGYPVSPTVMK